MLEYENQMLLDLLHEDGLLVTAKGLGIERVLMSLLTCYTDAGNLVLVIGTSGKEEEFIISQLEDAGVNPVPKCVTADCSVSDRGQIYVSGGILFVTSRILVVDLLMNRVPADLITGIVVWKAHKILESCQEAFILRLYRQKNKTGFIKAFSSSPLSFTCGFCQVERIMKNLFVKKLYLWPRFHVDVTRCLNLHKPEVIELHLHMTSAMKNIQMSLLDLISSTVQELRLSNRSVSVDELNAENAISSYFDKMVKFQLEPIWNQLSTRTKQLIADLKLLRTVLLYLTQYDCITFYNLVSSLRTTEKAMHSAGWMLLPSADSLFKSAKERVFYSKDGPPTTSDKSSADKVINEPSLEVNPKWLALSEVLDEIRKSLDDSVHIEKVLVITADDRTSQQLREYLTSGAKKVLLRNFYRTVGSKLGMTPPPSLFKFQDDGGNSTDSPARKKRKSDKNSQNEETEITLTQIVKKYDVIGKEDDKDEENPENKKQLEADLSKRMVTNPLIVIQPYKNSGNPFSFTSTLKEVEPQFIVMYDADLAAVREIEVWQATRAQFACRVYFIIYKGTVEEQMYLTSIKKEKDAFEYLISEKASMVLPEYVDGRTDDHPDLARDLLQENLASEQQNEATRKGDKNKEGVLPLSQNIIVDMREFRSELPALIHKRGIDIDPATIEVGDYILTPDICVERKSLSDLIGSLNSGRLYNQALAMTRFYKKPVLLIEFDHNKPFHLQGRFFLSNDSSSSNKDVAAKLQLLTLHFPGLRLLWSPSPYATADLFQMLKANKEQPSVAAAQAVTSEADPEYDLDKFNPKIRDFVAKLPGVTSKNICRLLRSVSDLPELLSLTKDELCNTVDNSKHGTVLYEALHSQLQPSIEEPGKGAKSRGKLTRKGLPRFRK